MAEQELEPTASPGIHLISAFLAMETTDTLLCLAREFGGGKVTEEVQRFIWDHCLTKNVGTGNKSYLKKFVKKLITEIESSHDNVLDELYEQYASYMTSLKDTNMVKENERVCKCISFLFPGDCIELSSCPTSRKLLIPLQCSLNMLEGDTGCSIWPSSLFLSELILSYPHIFSGKSCFEVGSGVGLIGICLSHIKASKVRLSDGDSSTLANMKLNLEMNHLNTETDLPEISTGNSNLVKCIHLPWESASEKELNELMPEIILGADVIYNPSCLPHLVQLLAILLNKKKSCDNNYEGSPQNYLPELTSVDGKASNASQGQVLNADAYEFNTNDATSTSLGSRADPVAYIASVIRNIDTFNHFLSLADQADLTITDLTDLVM
ncbi:Nicotinamide N-methyltransferase-like protein [Corchorus capsularis]|uniref:Nicotinamide N-methyltransferase-like protein n=1 Tax=Corchorus capsularis TaxID=210143 RepID=A0A1R3GWE2_COCAP|nr:Nicotinamide N-methyltransferase-like protein [Corchorus capsularis]